MITDLDTIPLLHMLADSPHEMLSRGELKRKGVTDDLIAAAKQRGQIIIAATDNARDGELSSIASVFLTDTGSDHLDTAEAG